MTDQGRKARWFPFVAGAAACLFACPSVRAGSGSWTGAESAAWTNSQNWSASPYPAGANTATFNTAGNANTVIDLAGLSSIFNITFDTPSAAAYTLGAGSANEQTLTLENSGLVSIGSSVASSQAIQAALVLGTTRNGATYTLTNASPDCVLTVAGNISVAPSGGTASTNTLRLTGDGRTILNGAISNGGAVRLDVNTYGTNTLAGDNAFTGNIIVYDGTLRLTHSNALGTGSKNASANNNVNDRNPSFVLDGSAGDLTIPTNITFVTSNQRAGAVINVAGNNTILGNFTLTSGDGATHIWSKGGRLTIAGNMTPNATDRQLYLRGDSDGEVSGVIANGSTTSGLKIYKDVGTGTWTFSGANTYTGATTVSAGALAVAGASGTLAASPLISVSGGAALLLVNSAASNHADRLKDNGAISLNNATLAFVNDGTAATFSETVGVVTVVGGGNTLSNAQAQADCSSTLTLSSLIRSGSATVNFAGQGLGQSDRNRIFIAGQPDGPIGNWATVNGAEPASYSSAQGVFVEGLTEIGAQGDTVQSGATNVSITTAGTTGPNLLSNATTAIGSLVQKSPYASALNMADKTLQVGSVSIAAGMADLTLGLSPDSGNLTPASAGGDLLLVNNSASGALTVNAVVADNASPSTLTKSGANTVVLAGSNTLSGAVAVNQGSLTVANSLALQSAWLTTSGAVFDSSVASRSFTLGNLLNSFSLPLADSAANPISLTVGNNGANSTFGGVISGSGSLTKAGSGTLTLTGASTYSGGTTVSEGALATGVAGGLGTGPVTNDATLNLTAANVTYTALGTSLAGTGTVNVTLNAGATNNNLNGDYSAFTGVWNVGVTGLGGKATMNGADNAAATLNILTNAAVLAAQPVTHHASAFLYGGDTGESYGQLRLEGSAEWAGPVKLANDVTGSGDGFFGGNSGTGTVSGVISDVGGAHPVNKVGGGVTLFTGTENTYAGQTWVRAGTLGVTKLANAGQAGSLGQPAGADSAIKIGNGGTSARLAYFGTGETTDKTVDLAGTTGNAYLTQAGSGLLTFTSDLSYSGAGGKTLFLEGSTDGIGELAGVFSDGLPYTNKLIKAGTGKWVLSNVNTHRGETEIQNGTLSLTHPNALSASSTVRFTSQNGVLSLDHNGAGETLMDLTVGVGNSGTLASGAGAGGAGINHAFSDFSLSQVTVRVTRASSVTSGSPSISAKTVNLSGGNTYTTVLYPLDADLTLGSVAILSGSYAKVLRLDGVSAGNTITGAIYNSLNTLSVYKANASTWTLSGSNIYSGTTTVNGGILALTGDQGFIASSNGIVLNAAGTLRLSSSQTQNHPNRVRDATGITLNGGTLDFAHPADAADYSEALGAVTLAADSASTVTVSRADSGRASTLTLASLARNPNARIHFQGDGLGADPRNRILIPAQAEGFIGLWASCNGDSPALYSATLGVYDGQFSDMEIEARGPTSTVPNNASANVRITAPGTSGPVALEGAGLSSVGILQQCSATTATVATAGKTLLTHALAISAGQEALALGVAEGDGGLTALGSKIDLINDSSSPLTIRAAVSNNTGAVALVKSGTGEVVLSGPCTYTGETAINAGSLNFRANAATQTLASVISGGGALVKSGTNELRLMAANTYTGPTTISEGIVRPDQNSAFGTSAGGVFIADGATLDVGCSADVGGTRSTNELDLGSEVFTVSGSGVGGQGAIVNNALLSQYRAFGRISLAGPTTIGGTQRWDVRQNTPTLTLNDFTLTKTGPNLIGLNGANVYPGAGHIDVQQGTLRLEGAPKLNGGPTNVLTIRSGAKLEQYNDSNTQYWQLVLENNATFDAAYNSDASTRNRWAGPITLNGAVTLTGGSGYVANLLGEISGAGSFNKTGSSNITLSGTNNTYTGSTAISAGTLTVSNLCSVGKPCSLGAPATVSNGTIKIGSGSTGAALAYSGAGDTSDRVIDLAGTTGGASLYQSGGGPLTLSGGVTASGSGAKTLTLRGNSAPLAELSGPIVNPASGRVAIQKSDSSTWVLSGNNSYTGDVTVSNGKLILSGVNAQALGALTVANAAADGIVQLAPGCQLTSTGTGKRAGGIMIGTLAGAHGALYMEDGATVSRTPGTGDDQAFTVGMTAGSYGYFCMSGGNLKTTRIQTGLSGTTATTNTVGNVRITGGVITLRDYILLARGVGSQSAFTVQGGVIYHTNTSERISLGYEGGRAELNLTGGSLLSTTNLIVRQTANNSTGIVNLCAGTLTVNHVVNTAPGVAFLNFAGGTLKASTLNTTAFISSTFTGVYSYGPFESFAGGAVIDTASRAVTAAAPIRAPSGQGVTGIILSDKGSGFIGEPYVAIQGGEGIGATAVANMEDDLTGNGTYRVASITVTCPGTGYTSAPSVLFNGGGRAAAAPAVSEVRLAANTSGGLNKLGAGTLTLGAANTYTGATAVTAGTLKLGVAAALPTQTSVILAGGTLDLSGYTVTNALAGSGLVTNGTVQTILSPAGEGAIGTNELTLAASSLLGTYLADVSPAGACDLVSIQGNINLNNFALQLVNPDALATSKAYTLLTCAGTRTGMFSSANLPGTRWHLLYRANGEVQLRYSDGTLLKIQ